MAAQISHIVAGEQALEIALGSWSPGGDALPQDTAAHFRLGCQGPDIFYHNQRTKPSGLHYGSLAHRRMYGSLMAAAAAAVPEGERGLECPAGAYLLGLATHAAVDRATHPFIIYFSGWVDPSDPGTERLRGCHPFLERLLDISLIEGRLGLTPREYGLASRLSLDNPANTQAAGRADSALVTLWAAGLRAAYPRATGSDSSLPERIANALADARNFYTITDPEATAPGGRNEDWIGRMGGDEWKKLVSIVYPESVPTGMDVMNEAGVEWQHPSADGRCSSASYPEVLAQGVKAAAKAISLVLAFWRSEIPAQALADGIGEGCLALCDVDGTVVRPRVCRPLALPEAMQAEYTLRTGDHVDVSPSGRYDAEHEHEG